MNPTEHKPELPAEVREAIINTIYQPGFWQRKEPVTELCAALAPLWPKQPAPTADAQQVAKRICDLAEIVRRDGGEWIALDVEKVAAVLAGYTNQPPAPSDAEVELAGWKADADRCREKWTHYEKLCDQLRAEVQAKQHAIDAAAAQIAQLSAEVERLRSAEWGHYRRLNEGEMVQVGDEYLCGDDEGPWKLHNDPACNRPAPDPTYPAHTLYRRKIADDLRAQLAAAQEAIRYADEELARFETTGAELFRINHRAAIDAARAKEDRSHA